MAQRHFFDAIPEPQSNLQSLLETVKALKVSVEMLCGHRQLGPAAHIFVQADAPNAVGVGDLWIDRDGRARYWNGSIWVKVLAT